ncbi:MAG: ATP-grasp domain-containing protein [Candidatus Muiribacteriaceae bacterium]
MKTLVVIGGGLFQTFAVRKAKKTGICAVCCDMDEHAPGREYADHFLQISTRDYDSIIKSLKNMNITPDGVITVGTDMSRTVYEVSRAFGLDPGFKCPDSVVNKIKMRSDLRSAGVPSPEFVFSEDVDNLIVRRNAENLDFPLVMKPSENMGARGVIRVDSDKDIRENWSATYRYSPDGKVLLEEYMEGDEISVECLVINGKCHPLVFGDRHIEKAPFFVETGHSCPSGKSENILSSIADLMDMGAKALGIYNAPAKGDIRITPYGVMIGEIAARLSGGFMSSHTLPLSTGIDAISLAIRQRIGSVLSGRECMPVKDMVCIERALIPECTGVIRDISGVKEALSLPGVEYIHMNLSPGDEFSSLTSNIGKAGNVIIRAEDRSKAEKIWETVRKTVKISI